MLIQFLYTSKDFNACKKREKISSLRHRHHINTEERYFLFRHFISRIKYRRGIRASGNHSKHFFRFKILKTFFTVVLKLGQFKRN